MSMIEFSCPSCHAQYRVPAKAGGKQATCKSCGETISVPKGAGSSASGSSSGGSRGSSGSSRNVDLTGLYHGAEAGAKSPVVAAPSMEGGSVFAKAAPRRSGPNPTLLIGIGGGAIILILAVVLVVVLMGGGGGSKPDPTAGPAVVDTGPTRSRSRGTNNEPAEGTNPGTTPPTPTPPVAVDMGRLIDPPDAGLEDVVDWSLPVSEKVAAYAERVEVRGIVVSLPPEWESETTSVESFLSDEGELRDMMVQGLGRVILETALMDAAPSDASAGVEFMMSVARKTEDTTWPTFRSIDSVGPETLGLQDINLDQLREASSSPDPEVAAKFGALNAMAGMFDSTSVAFNMFKPDGYFIKKGNYESVEYGTLLGGHPFARVVLDNQAGDTKTLLYAGTVGDMQVTMMASVPRQSADLLADMDWVMRSARLMTPTQAREYARGDTVYASWIDSSMDITYAGDNVPHAGLDRPGWDGFTADSLFQNAAAASLVTPYRQPYGLIAPEGMRLATTNRVAARWAPDENGLWLQLKVTKLEGREQRTMASPILPAEGDAGERLFIYSNTIDLPAGYEHSELPADGLTLHRVLLPAVQGQPLRKVYYILFDGPDQVTVEGHFDTSRPEDLEQLDAAAGTLTKT